MKGVATNLLRREGGLSVTLETVEHYLPDPGEVLASGTFADTVTPLGSYAWAESQR